MKDKNENAVTVNGVTIHGIGVHTITRRGNLATESLGYGVAVMCDNGNGRVKLRMLADLLKGTRAIEGAAYEKYTAEAYTRERALHLADDLSKAWGAPLLDEERKALEELKKAAAATKEERTANESKGENEKKAPRTPQEKVSVVVNKLKESERIGALLAVLATLNAPAAAAARLVIAGQGINEASRAALKAEEEQETARKSAEIAARG